MGKKKFTQEFKIEAVELANREGVGKAAEELGVNAFNIRRWKSEKINPRPIDEAVIEKEIKRLRKENEYLRKINDVLKKSTAIFSQDHYQNFK